jgi:hypothetical protein
MPSQQRETPPPLEGNDLVIAAACTIGWAVALIVLLVLRHQIPASSRWWIWSCVVGFGIGIFSLLYVPHLKRSRARTAARRAGSSTSADGSGTSADGTG